jgi:hypothetical protein
MKRPILSRGTIPDQKAPAVRADRASPHTPQITYNFFAHNRLCQLTHPSYFPEILPPDFELFGKVKNYLIGKFVRNEQRLLDDVIAFWIHVQALN